MTYYDGNSNELTTSTRVEWRRSRDGGARLAAPSSIRIFKRVKKRFYQHDVVNSILLGDVSLLWYSAVSRFCDGVSGKVGGFRIEARLNKTERVKAR